MRKTFATKLAMCKRVTLEEKRLCKILFSRSWRKYSQKLVFDNMSLKPIRKTFWTKFNKFEANSFFEENVKWLPIQMRHGTYKKDKTLVWQCDTNFKYQYLRNRYLGFQYSISMDFYFKCDASLDSLDMKQCNTWEH